MAKRHNIAKSTSNYKEILKDDNVDLVLITTQHNMHASMVLESIKAKKSVFVEKPLALTNTELEEIIQAYNKQSVNVSVGFNRRFAPIAKKMKKLLGSDNTPVNIVATMNAGFIPAEVWVHDMEVGGGRIIGEACHYLDLMVYITGSKIKAVCMNALGENPAENTDNASILVKMENGSTGVVNYFANGSKSYAKERLEVFSQEKTLIMENFIKTTGYGTRGFSKLKTKLDKGHRAQFGLIVEKIKGGDIALIPYDELINVTKASFAAIQSLKEGKWIEIE
jgi:predicted dehydrogenase